MTLRFGFGRGMDSEGQGDVQVRLRRFFDEIILKRMGGVAGVINGTDGVVKYVSGRRAVGSGCGS